MAAAQALKNPGLGGCNEKETTVLPATAKQCSRSEYSMARCRVLDMGASHSNGRGDSSETRVF